MTRGALGVLLFAWTPAPPDDVEVASEPARVPAEIGASAAVNVRTDSDHTTVVSPRVHFSSTLGSQRNRLDVVYTADVWTSASVDIRTAATAAVTEQRDEVGVGYRRSGELWNVDVGYRLSHEIDYLSNSAAVSGRVETFERNTTFDVRAFGGIDRVGRAGDERFREWVGSYGAYFGWTQVLARATLLQISGELRGQHGYLASPYRFVSLGGGGRCSSSLGLCVAEDHPNARLRMAAVARVRQGLSKRWSLGGAYRFYADDWRLLAHTGIVDVRVAPKRTFTLGLEYRLYRQGAASFYRREYSAQPADAHVTRDRELSPLWSHRLALAFDGRWATARGPEIHAGAVAGGSHFRYDDFIGLSRVWALELAVLVGVQL